MIEQHEGGKGEKQKRRRMKRPRGCGAVFLRGRIWWYQVRGDKQRSSRSTVKGDAEKLLQARLDELRLGRQPASDPTTATYGELEVMLVADLKANQRRSVKDAGYRLRHLRAFFGGMRARDITYDVVTGYVARRLGAAASSTVLYEVKLLRRMFALARRAGKVAHVPPLPTVGVGDNARKGFCSPEEIERVIDHLPGHAKPAVRMLYLTGWRTGEVLGLEWRRVDFEAGTLTLDAAHSKSGRARTFPFGQLAPLAELLREQRERTSALERERGRIIPHVFHIDGQPIGSFRSAWRTAVKNAGLPGLRPHDLRRSAARNLVRAGVSEGVVMKLCGWTTRHMFDRYNVADTRDLEDGVGRLSEFFRKRSPRRSSRAAER